MRALVRDLMSGSLAFYILKYFKAYNIVNSFLNKEKIHSHLTYNIYFSKLFLKLTRKAVTKIQGATENVMDLKS